MAKNLPISQKAYERFCTRIKKAHELFFMDPSDMLHLLDSYLEGRDTCMDDISPVQRFAFLILIDEVDKAMARSARARRPRKHKCEEKDETKGNTPGNIAIPDAPIPSENEQKPEIVPQEGSGTFNKSVNAPDSHNEQPSSESIEDPSHMRVSHDGTTDGQIKQTPLSITPSKHHRSKRHSSTRCRYVWQG